MRTYAIVVRTALAGWGRVRRVVTASKRPMYDPKRITVVRIDGITPLPEKSWYYDFNASVFQENDPGVPARARARAPLRWKEFWYGRMKPPERAKATAAMNGVNLSGVTLDQGASRWRMRIWEVGTRDGVRLDGPETTWAVNLMETSGMVAPGRAAEILG